MISLQTKISLFSLFLFYLFYSGLARGEIETGGNGNEIEEWRSASATYVKENQLSGVTGGACGYGDLDEAGYGRDTAGLSSALFGRGGACGVCFEIRCVDHIHWCLQGSPSIVVTATDFCAPNWWLPDEDGGWCNFPREHFEMSVAAFAGIAKTIANVVPVQYRRVKCQRTGGMRFTVTGSSYFHQVLITNVGSDGEITAVKVKGTRTGWISMGRNWGQIWQCDADLRDQPLSFEVTTRGSGTVTSYHVAPSTWQFRQTFEGKQFV